MCSWRSLMCAKEICSSRSGLCLAVDDLPGSRLVNVKNLDDLHFSGHRLVLHLTGLFQKFDFPGQLTFQSSDDLQFSHPPDDLHVSHPGFYSEILPLEFIIAYEKSKDKKKDTEVYYFIDLHAFHKTDHKQNYYRSFLYKDKLGLHLIRKKTLSEDIQEVQTTSRKSRRLLGSPDDFQEVQTTSRKVIPEFGKKVRTLYNKKLPNEEKSDIKTYQNTEIYYERETSLEDFQEVQTTSTKSSLVHYILDN
ncbi:hypothetical protein IGI04_002259 [Brassica rapa subsp. trilocularis]|uniref:Uncharacterized protein n=1 Tax=Brassica rapa subsp. trilocularis TaxID=1813537 RepID=A0ABQ7NV19_BRACM|nr:hypothetical protein IGI04_002259 [Brassica rapa subsp. trilocularis]